MTGTSSLSPLNQYLQEQQADFGKHTFTRFEVVRHGELAEETVKELNGGSATITGRDMYSSKQKFFPWITKAILSANENKLPHFNVEDTALVERLMCIPHRSRFFTEQVPDEEFSFPADPHIKERFGKWRPYFLKWQLAGLALYHKEGFRNMPESCLKFKRELVADKDMVLEFLDGAVEQGEVTDFIKLKDLYHDFEESYKLLQRDKKTKKTFKMFESALGRCLQGAVFKAKHDYSAPCGKKTSARNVVLGYKVKHDSY